MKEILQYALDNLKIDCGHIEHNQHDIWENATNAYEKRIKELENELTTLEAPPWVDVNVFPDEPYSQYGPHAKNIAYLHHSGYVDTNNIYFLVGGSAKIYGYTHYIIMPPAPEQTP